MIHEMGLLDLLLFIFYYILPVAIPLTVLYKLGLRLTPGFVVFAIILSFVVAFYVDVVMPLHTSFSLESLLKTVSEQFNLSSLPVSQGMMVLRLITLTIHTIATSIILIPVGIILKLARGE